MRPEGNAEPTSDQSLIALRRDLHSYPELRFEEVRTAQRIAAEIAPYVDSMVQGVGGTGILARVDGLEPGKTVLIRCDIDAYPVADAKAVDYRSRNPGVSHACGHDVHTAIGIGVLRYFARNRPARGSVAVIFQPAAEIPFGGDSGAATVLASEALRDVQPIAVLGLHCWPQLVSGEIGVERRIAMAAKDAFEITVSGLSVHAATPASGRDAILAASSLVAALHAGVGRRRDPHEQVAFNIGTIRGGTAQSSLASEVTLTGTLRTHEEEVRGRLRSVIAAAVEGTSLQFDVATKLRWANEMNAVVNDSTLVALARTSLSELATVVDLDPGPMTTDDFALYSVLAPTLYLKLGVAAPGHAPSPPLHSGAFDVDERCLDMGVAAMARLCLDILSGSAGGSECI